MKSKTVTSVLFVITLVACNAAETRVLTQDIDLENPKITVAVANPLGDIDIGDGGLLSGWPCPSPCVFGIRVGETQLDQVIPVLEKNGISQCLTEENISWYLIYCSENRLFVQVDMHTNIVNAIWFYPSIPVSLGDIIEKYEEPNYVTVDLGETPGTIQPRFYWNSIRMGVILPEIFGETYEVEKTSVVAVIGFSNEDLYRTAKKKSDPYYRPWNGYGMYRPRTSPGTTPRATSTPRE